MPTKGTKKIMGIEIPDDATQPGIPMYQKSPTDLAIPNEFKIGNQLLNKATLIAQRNEDVKHVVAGIEDTAGYKKAVELRATYRTTRTSLEKFRKEKSLPHQEFVKKLKEATDELGKECAIAEEYFSDMITAVDNEKERIRQEKEAEKQRVIQGRVQQLISLGAIFNGNEYVFPYDESMNVSALYVKETSDENWADDIKVVMEAYTAEQSRIETERQQAEQEALVAQQQKEEAELLIQQQSEANEKESKRLLEQRTAMRVKELTKLHGLVLDEDRDVYSHPTKPLWVSNTGVEGASDEEWDRLMAAVESYVEPVSTVTFSDNFIEEAQPDILGMATELNESTTSEIKTVERFLKFDDTNTHFDIYISSKRTIRLFFVEFKEVALAGCDVDKEGNYQGLHWAIIKT